MKKYLKLLLLLLLIIPLFNVKAQSFGEYSETGNEITNHKSYNHSYFMAGNNINSDINVDGILFAAGNDVNLSSQTEYGFIAGNTIAISKENLKDLFVAGDIVNFKEGYHNGRDLYALGSTVNLAGNIDSNVFAAGSNITIANANINDNVYLDASNITIGDNVTINGSLKYNDDATINGLDKLGSTSIETYTNKDFTQNTILDQTKSTLISIFSLLIVAFVIIKFKQDKVKLMDEEKVNDDSIFKKALIGLGVLFCVPLISIILMVTIIGLPLGLIILAIYSIALYLSVLPVSYLIGKYFINKVLKSKCNIYLVFTYGIIIVKLISLIPWLGSVLYFLIMLIGLGYFYQFGHNKKYEKQ